ncbi:MAG TPA: dihydroorotate dehydrogenase-like protein [Actinomycetota bacterium]|nr:dihydroorotate dehydrogenase-like protein [Actinomycetota bacterium]
MSVLDLTTHYLAMPLRNPLVASASPLGASLDTLVRLEDAGAGAVVLPSLFEEQIVHEELEVHRLLFFGAESHPEAWDYFPQLDDYNTGPDGYLRHLERAKSTLAIPVIASLNGSTRGGWLRYARRLQDAGADAIELNVYEVAADPEVSGRAIEQELLELVASVRAAVTVPLAVKCSPYFTAMAHMAIRLEAAGADGLVLFNRFVQPEIDLDRMAVVSKVHLSLPDELRLRLRWIALLRGHLRVSLAATGGIHSATDAVKVLLAGADVAMMASALLANGPEHLGLVLAELSGWMANHGYTSVRQLQGAMSQQSAADPAAFERVQYMKALTNYSPPDTMVGQ